MNILKKIFKIIVVIILFLMLVEILTAIGLVTLTNLNIDTSSEFGANIKVSIEIFSFIFALFLSIQSYRDKRYFKWTIILFLFSILVVLILSVLVTNIILNSDNNISDTQRDKFIIESSQKPSKI